VIPVYQAEKTLHGVLAEIQPLTKLSQTEGGVKFVVTEVLPVYDHGPDHSEMAIRQAASDFDFVRPVWLSRNYGQHPATIAGMASSNGDWIVTMDEDGQHDPADIGRMLDCALKCQADLVYAKPVTAAPHSAFRNVTSRGAKIVVSHLLSSPGAPDYQSYRLVLGEIGRSVAAYAGPGIYLDVALGWISNRVATCPVTFRTEGDRRSGYNLRRLLSHFWRMVVSSGTRGLRMVSVLGGAFAAIGLIWSLYLLVEKCINSDFAVQPGWTSLMILLLLTAGAVLFSLGVIAEYIGVNVNMAMGKPLYLIVSDPLDGPLGHEKLSPKSKRTSSEVLDSEQNPG
jgi:undecaprenyl-phosphate 4-deoxy-4-formamido-L-arabinose transferase